MAKKIAVIGAGASGITAMKCCLDEKLEPVCFERTGSIGGLWNFTPEVVENQACVMKSTVINTSKEMMCYSDFPIPKEYPNFMHNTHVQKYFLDYVKHFDLEKYIRFHTEVLEVKRAADFASSGKWDIRIKDLKNDKEETVTFDGVLVCTGHHASKNVPEFPGLSEFQGQVLHSHDYKDFHGFEDKRIVIVGIGNSGGDLAVELSRVSKVFLSTRRGSWVINRVSDYGIPVDMLRATRFMAKLQKLIPKSLLQVVAASHLNKRFDHKLYSLQPKHQIFGQHPTVNDDLPNRIICGSVTIKDDIKRFTKTGVEFVDGTKEDNIDAVILATGYIFGFPFIDKSVINVEKNRVTLFKYMFPPRLEHPTLAIIGCIQPLGAIMPISELQCRLATRVFKGDVKLPSQSAMLEDIKDKEEKMAARYVASQRHTIQVDYVAFMDELGELNGCKPDLWELMKTDPKLGLKCLFGPCTPYQYRLVGPGKWDKAREMIMTQWDRVNYPLQTRSTGLGPDKSSFTTYLLVVLLVVVLAYFFNLI